MEPFTSRPRSSWIACAVVVSLLGGAGVRASELDEIKETQRKILERLDSQDKALKEILQKLDARQPVARPQIDPNKVYTIPVGTSAIRGPMGAKVTMVEFSDYQ